MSKLEELLGHLDSRQLAIRACEGILNIGELHLPDEKLDLVKMSLHMLLLYIDRPELDGRGMIKELERYMCETTHLLKGNGVVH